MAISIPSDLARHRFHHPSEFQVYEALVSGLRDDWVILPSLEMRLEGSFAERELDLLLLHRNHGIVLVEVKSFPMRIEGGRFFYEEGGPVERDPLNQITAQRNFLTRELKDLDEFIYSKIRVALATPAVIEVTGSLPAQLRSEQLLDSARLSNPEDAILDLVFSDQYTVPLGVDLFEQIIERLAPSAALDTSPQGIQAIARARMERRLEAETKVMESLDANQRVIVTGGAGSGKTRLAAAWARRAYARDERVLFTCFNDPLGETLRQELEALDGVVIAPFLRYFASAPGLTPAPPQAEGESDSSYWLRVEQWAVEHFSEIGEQFDTIIVDEVQDFSPIRLTMLEELLDPEGPQRILMVGDPAQSIRRTGFRPLTDQEGWVRAELVSNNRNAPEIARLLRSKLGGAPAPNADPFGAAVEAIAAETDEDVATAVQRISNEEQSGTTWVLTTRANMRDLLRWRLGLVKWEDRNLGVVCETVYRLKGLEAERVILVVHDADDSDQTRQLLYAGASRALETLVIIGPSSVVGKL